MGYILQIRAGHLDSIVEELGNPSLGVPEDDDGMLSEQVAENWVELQRLVADAVRSGREFTAGSDVAGYVATVLEQLSHFWNAVQHTSSGGAEFQAELGEAPAELFGADYVRALASRPLLGISSDDHPLFGYVTRGEAAVALERAEQSLPALSQQGEIVRALHQTTKAAVERGFDLIGIYT